MQDALRGRRYPRTPYCRALAAGYLFGVALAAFSALAMSGARILVPFVIAAPLAMLQLAYDAKSRGRELLPEIAGAIAMTSVAAAIAMAAGREGVFAFGLAGILAARFVPAILYVRAALGRLPGWIAIALHVAALGGVALYAPPPASMAMIVLLLRAAWGLSHAAPRAQTIGWREIVYGAVTVGLVAAAY